MTALTPEPNHSAHRRLRIHRAPVPERAVLARQRKQCDCGRQHVCGRARQPSLQEASQQGGQRLEIRVAGLRGRVEFLVDQGKRGRSGWRIVAE